MREKEKLIFTVECKLMWKNELKSPFAVIAIIGLIKNYY